jgi:hypothetical protein
MLQLRLFQLFDITEALSQAAPRDNLLMPEYTSICPMSTMRTRMEKRVQPSPLLSCPGTEAQVKI